MDNVEFMEIDTESILNQNQNQNQNMNMNLNLGNSKSSLKTICTTISDFCDGNGMGTSQSASSATIAFHPLVIMNISDHWTRVRAQAKEENQVYGALIGKQKGRNVEIMNSFEFKMDVFEEEIIINRDYYNTKEQQYKQVFSDLDLVGWYTTGDSVGEREKKIHKQISEIHECPILLQLDPHSGSVNKLPITIYESIVDIVQGETSIVFVPLTYTLTTEEAERIGVDHVARMTTNDAPEKSAAAEHLIVQHNAIKMLHNRVKVILKYVRAVASGELTQNHEILREVQVLSSRLPVLQYPSFNKEFYTQSNDVSLMTYLGAITKGCNDINHLVSKFNVLHDRQSTGKRMRGLFF